MIQDRADVGLNTLGSTAFQMMVNGSQTPGLAQVFTTFTTRVPQIFVDVDRVKAKSMGVTLGDYNHDGRLDILQAGSGDGRSAVEQVVFGEHTNEYRSGHSVIFLRRRQCRVRLGVAQSRKRRTVRHAGTGGRD
jgi:hypothetical protein